MRQLRSPACVRASHVSCSLGPHFFKILIRFVLCHFICIFIVQGFSLGSLIYMVLLMDPAILVTALLATTTVFVCFAGAALLAKRRTYLYLGGVLSSGLMGKSTLSRTYTAFFLAEERRNGSKR